VTLLAAADCLTSVNLVNSDAGLTSGGTPTGVSTQTLVDRSSVRLNLCRVTTVDVGPLAVGSGERRRVGGAAVCSVDTATLTGESTSMFAVRSSWSSAVVTTSTCRAFASASVVVVAAAETIHSYYVSDAEV